MGWCSGTPIFDAVVKVLLPLPISDEEKAAVITSVAEAMWEHDWDCEGDSEFYDHPLVHTAFLNSSSGESWAEYYAEADEDE